MYLLTFCSLPGRSSGDWLGPADPSAASLVRRRVTAVVRWGSAEQICAGQVRGVACHTTSGQCYRQKYPPPDCSLLSVGASLAGPALPGRAANSGIFPRPFRARRTLDSACFRKRSSGSIVKRGVSAPGMFAQVCCCCVETPGPRERAASRVYVTLGVFYASCFCLLPLA